MPTAPLLKLVLYQQPGALPASMLLAQAVRDYLRDFRQLHLTDLDVLLEYVERPDRYRLNGYLTLDFRSRTYQEQAICWLTESETIVFAAEGYAIRTYREEDRYGDRLIINELRLDRQMSVSDLLAAGSAAFDELTRIMAENGSILTVGTHQFALTKRRASPS